MIEKEITVNQVNHRTAVGIGSVKKAEKCYKSDTPMTTVTVQYMISGRDYEFSEDVECSVDAVTVGQPIKIAYNPHAPASAHIVGNKTRI